MAVRCRNMGAQPEGGRYFEELLARIRDIRSSEKVFWRKVLDIYATSIDYDPKNDLCEDRRQTHPDQDEQKTSAPSSRFVPFHRFVPRESRSTRRGSQ